MILVVHPHYIRSEQLRSVLRLRSQPGLLPSEYIPLEKHKYFVCGLKEKGLTRGYQF
jgi:hypothetical protein